MENELITLRGKQVLLGAGLGRYKVGKGHFICIKEANFIRAHFIIGVARTNEAAKEISMKWGELEIASQELKPLPEFFDDENKPLVVVNSKDSTESVSDATKGKTVEVAPGYFMYPYDAFYMMQGTDKAGIVLYAIAMDKFMQERYGVSVLKMEATGYRFIQPVTADLEKNERQEEEDPYILTINAIDGIAPFTYSLTGVNYGADNVFQQANPILGNVYVKDADGTIAKFPVGEWPPLPLAFLESPIPVMP